MSRPRSAEAPASVERGVKNTNNFFDLFQKNCTFVFEIKKLKNYGNTIHVLRYYYLHVF